MNTPQFKIHGTERRKLKKKYNLLKSFVKNYWRLHHLDKDMCKIYGCENLIVSEDNAKIIYDKNKKEFERLEIILKEPYETK